jgi:uncharacterized protein
MKRINRNAQILLTEEFVKENINGYDSGHDWWHIERVRKLALYINAAEELTDPFIVEVTALLHDTVDSKFAGNNIEKGYLIVSDFMDKAGMSEIKDRVLNAIKHISFSSNTKNGSADDSLLLTVQDADRLDAIGAIGIARAFNYGGFRNNKIYDPDAIKSGSELKRQNQAGASSTISHFYEKLLVLKDLMNTSTAKRLAYERHEFLEVFLEQFYKEWNFDGKREETG